MAKTILIVDDEPDILSVTIARLKYSGYAVLTAIDAEKALDVLQKSTPNLILLDLLLPKMQGDELCKKLKADNKYKHIPIILFTASTLRTNIPAVIKAIGADDCIIKPFEPDELIAKIEKLIK